MTAGSTARRMRRRRAVVGVALALGLALAACVPPTPPPPRPTEAQIAERARLAEQRAQAAAQPSAQSKHAGRKDGLEGGKLVFEDRFDRSELGNDWTVAHAGEWDIDDGRLRANLVRVYDDRNQGVWLQRRLPKQARIEFDAEVISDKGDVKCEVFARKAAHETGYSIIFGGWDNTINTIARLGEHEPSRAVQVPHKRVQSHKRYHWTIVRTDNVVRWYVDGEFMLDYDDAARVDGPFFGFNNWTSDVRFDDLRIYDVGAEAE
jgi:hypothetical protein